MRRRAIAARSPCGSTPVTERAVSANSGRWKPVPQPMSRTSRPAQGPSCCIRRGDGTGAVDRAVLDLVDVRVVPDVGARDGVRVVGTRAAATTVRCGRGRWGSGTWRPRCRACRWGPPIDLDVLERLARPTGRATPRRGPGRRRSRGTPARPVPVAPALGWLPGSMSHSMKNGSWGSACRPLTPSCFQSSSMPSGRCRLPLTASRPSRASSGVMSSTATTQPSQPPPSAERARTAWPNGALSDAGWSRTSTTSK